MCRVMNTAQRTISVLLVSLQPFPSYLSFQMLFLILYYQVPHVFIQNAWYTEPKLPSISHWIDPEWVFCEIFGIFATMKFIVCWWKMYSDFDVDFELSSNIIHEEEKKAFHDLDLALTNLSQEDLNLALRLSLEEEIIIRGSHYVS